MTTRRDLLAGAAGAGLFAALPAKAQQRLISGPVQIIVPVSPSTAQDVLARQLAPALSEALGQPVVVENRTGASGAIGSNAVARAAPDGRMLLMQGAPLYMSAATSRNLPYDVATAFKPIVLVASGSSMLCVPANHPARDLAAFVAAARARPGEVDYGSSGVGTAPHMSMELFALSAGIQLNHIPYRSTAPVVQDLLAGRVQAAVLPIAIAMPLARNGQLRILATTAPARWPELPEVPTMEEAGLGAATVVIQYGLYGPAALPDAIAAEVNRAVNAWLARAETRASLTAQGLTPGGGTPAEFDAIFRRELETWARVVRDARVPVE
jgi:tripartite-type tricarboxylate transporter receptor subunit TctC